MPLNMALAAKSGSSVTILADSWCICSLSLPLSKALGLWNNYVAAVARFMPVPNWWNQIWRLSQHPRLTNHLQLQCKIKNNRQYILINRNIVRNRDVKNVEDTRPDSEDQMKEGTVETWKERWMEKRTKTAKHCQEQCAPPVLLSSSSVPPLLWWGITRGNPNTAGMLSLYCISSIPRLI